MKPKRFRFALLAWLTLSLGSGAFSLSALPLTDSQGQALPTLAPMIQRIVPAVVNISTLGRLPVQNNPLLNDPFFRRFFGFPEQPSPRQAQSLGSGVIVDAKLGYVLTNNHVIANADQITVALRDGRSLQAKLIGADPETDIAVIQIPAENIQALTLADSGDLEVGDFVVAIGNPFGLGQTVTSGIVSALGRTNLGIESYESFIQTDASINPGNSGGALVNLRGDLVGINTAILAPSGGNVGIGFAIPINMARAVMTQLVEFGQVRRGQLGVQTQDLTPELARAFNIPLADDMPGAVITQVAPGSAAEKAGLKSGDIIVSMDGDPVRSASELRNTVGLLPVGKALKIDVLRNGKTLTVNANIGENPQASMNEGGSGPNDPRLAGVVFGAIDERSRLFEQIQGIPVIQVQPGTPAAEAGLSPDDVVISVNNQAVRTPDELINASLPKDEDLLLNVRRGESALFIIIKAPA